MMEAEVAEAAGEAGEPLGVHVLGRTAKRRRRGSIRRTVEASEAMARVAALRVRRTSSRRRYRGCCGHALLCGRSTYC